MSIIYEVKITDAEGNLKEIITQEELSERHWDRFVDYNPKDLGLPQEVLECNEEKEHFSKMVKDLI